MPAWAIPLIIQVAPIILSTLAPLIPTYLWMLTLR